MLDLSSRARERDAGGIRGEREVVSSTNPPPNTHTHTYTPPAGVLVKFSTPYKLWQEVGSRALLSSSRFLAVVTSVCCEHMCNLYGMYCYLQYV